MEPITIQSSRGKSITVIGGLDNRVGVRHYEIIVGSNNAKTFINFLDGLQQKINRQPAHLVLDNLKVHHAKLVQEWRKSNLNL